MDLGYVIIAAVFLVVLIVLAKLFSRRSREDAGIALRGSISIGKKQPESAVPDTVAREVQRLLAEGKNDEAIALVSEKSGMPRDTSRNVVQVLQRLGTLGGAELSMTTTTRTMTLSQQDSAEIQRLIKQGNKIEAIKLIRERTGLGLKEAKGIADRLG